MHTRRWIGVLLANLALYNAYPSFIGSEHVHEKKRALQVRRGQRHWQEWLDSRLAMADVQGKGRHETWICRPTTATTANTNGTHGLKGGGTSAL